ncbi:MAG: hypothetical protein HN368_16255 [Spirochaetales bacterium]|nr:hypothetical protein [Spirochaetales bacterium]
MRKKLPNLVETVEQTPQYYKRQKEKLMRSIEMIKTGAYVIKRLSLKQQMELLNCVEQDLKFPEPLLAGLGEIDTGREFIREHHGKLLFPDLLHILSYDPALEKWLMDNLLEIKSLFFEQIAKNLFIFEDIVLLDDAALSAVRESADDETLLTAALTCPYEVKKKVVALLAADDDAEAALLSRIPVLETGIDIINRAKYSVVQIIRTLESEGKIKVQRLPEVGQ